MKALEEFGNRSLDNNSDIISFGTNTLVIKEQMKYLYDIKITGKKQQQFQEYLIKKVVNNTCAISDTTENNKFEIFLTFKSKTPSKFDQKLKLVKSDVCLFSRLFINIQTWDGDLDTFFAHENLATPQSPSKTLPLKLSKKKLEIPHEGSL